MKCDPHETRNGYAQEAFAAEASQLLIILLLGLAVASYYFTGYYASDDGSYLGSARQLLDDGQLRSRFGANRLGMVFLTAGLLKLGGGSVALAIYAFVFFHVALIALCYGIGRVAHDHRVGLASAALAAFFPLGYVYAGSLLPDVPLTVFLAAAFLLLLVVVRRAQDGLAPRGWQPTLLAFFAGLLVGLSYLVKEYAILFAVPAGAILATAAPLLSRQSIRLVIAFAVGLGLVLIGEVLLFRIVTHEWVFRLNLESDLGTIEHLRDLRVRQGIWPLERLAYLYWTLRWTLGGWALVFVAAFLAYPFLNRIDWPGRSTAMATFISGIWMGAYLLFGSSSLTEYLPAPIVDRYYVILAPFVIPATADVLVTVAVGLTRLLSRLSSPRRLPPAAAMLLVTAFIAFFALERVGATHRMAGSIYRAGDVASFLAAYRDATTDPSGLPILVSPYHAARLVQLFPIDDGWVVANVGSTGLIQNLVKLREPFLYVVPFHQSKQGPLDQFLHQAEASGLIAMTPAGRGRYDPPEPRWVNLREFLSPLREPSRNAQADHYAAQLLRIDPVVPGAKEENAEKISIPNRLPWVSLTKNFAVQANWLTWRAGKPGRRGRFQLFEGKNYKQAPRSDLAKLPEGTVSATANITVGATDFVRLKVRVYGYSGDKLVSQESRKLKMVPGRRQTVSLPVIGPGPEQLQSYNIRISIWPQNPTPGILTVQNVVMTSADKGAD